MYDHVFGLYVMRVVHHKWQMPLETNQSFRTIYFSIYWTTYELMNHSFDLFVLGIYSIVRPDVFMRNVFETLSIGSDVEFDFWIFFTNIYQCNKRVSSSMVLKLYYHNGAAAPSSHGSQLFYRWVRIATRYLRVVMVSKPNSHTQKKKKITFWSWKKCNY